MNKKILGSLLLSVSLLFFASCQKEVAKKANNMKSNNMQKPTLREINEEKCAPKADKSCPSCTDKCCSSNEKTEEAVSTSQQAEQNNEQEVSADITADDLVTDEDNSEVSSFENNTIDTVEENTTSQN
ncbi:MAG: hypothetical protein WCT85_06725 [Parachlamydiales bacterium]|jgi:hypothetical protein